MLVSHDYSLFYLWRTITTHSYLRSFLPDSSGMSLMRSPPLLLPCFLCIFIVLDREIEKLPLVTLSSCFSRFLLQGPGSRTPLGCLSPRPWFFPNTPIPKLSPRLAEHRWLLQHLSICFCIGHYNFYFFKKEGKMRSIWTRCQAGMWHVSALLSCQGQTEDMMQATCHLMKYFENSEYI